MKVINAKGIFYRELNQIIREEIKRGNRLLKLINVGGQRYIGDGLKSEDVYMEIEGVPGNDLAAFMDGPTIRVKGNAQDCVSNTMNSGKVIVEGMAGDVLGYGMRGGRLHILRDVGYRVGIHMKEYEDKIPVIIVGGKAGNFLGEYMAGGTLILLGMFSQHPNWPIVGDYLATGMHGGRIFIRGDVDPYLCGIEVKIEEANEEDRSYIEELLEEFTRDFGLDLKEIMGEKFTKITPKGRRPYGSLYAY